MGFYVCVYVGVVGFMGYFFVVIFCVVVVFVCGGYWCLVVVEGSFFDGGVEFKWFEVFVLMFVLVLIDSFVGRLILWVRF